MDTYMDTKEGGGGSLESRVDQGISRLPNRGEIRETPVRPYNARG